MKIKNIDFTSILVIGFWAYMVGNTCVNHTYNEFPIFWLWAVAGTIYCVLKLFSNFLGFAGKHASDEEREIYRQADREGKILWFRGLTVFVFVACFGWVGVLLQEQFHLDAGPLSITIAVVAALSICSAFKLSKRIKKMLNE